MMRRIYAGYPEYAVELEKRQIRKERVAVYMLIGVLEQVPDFRIVPQSGS